MFGAARILVTLWLNLFYRVKVYGAEKIPASGSAVLCANHTHFKDLILLGCNTKRKVKWLAKIELFKNPVIGKFLMFLGAFPVRRGENDVSAIKVIYDLLNKGEIVGIFPEGHRVKDMSKRPEIKRGYVTFAYRTKAPIIPVSIAYGKAPFGKSQVFSHIKVVFHDPVVLDYEKKYSNEELDLVAKDIMKNIYSEIA